MQLTPRYGDDAVIRMESVVDYPATPLLRQRSRLANILATPLKLLAPLLSAHVRPGGDLVLAGILDRQAGELKAAYAPWCRLEVADNEDGWILMTAQTAA